jgi:SNF family Na+-dependent transporter
MIYKLSSRYEIYIVFASLIIHEFDNLYLQCFLLMITYQLNDFLIFSQLDSLKDIQVWMDAAGQIFFSMAIGYGSTILFSSGNKRSNSFGTDALVVSLANSGTSLWASIIMFSFFGYRTHFLVEKCRNILSSNSSQSILAFMMSSKIEGNSTASVLANGTRNCSKQFFFEQVCFKFVAKESLFMDVFNLW